LFAACSSIIINRARSVAMLLQQPFCPLFKMLTEIAMPDEMLPD